MRKVLLIIITFVITLSLFSCNSKQIQHQPTEQEKTADRNITLVKDPVSELKMKYPGPELPESNIYVNAECGYKFAFPKEWVNWYFVNDENPEIATVRFYGKSIRGTIMEKAILSEGFDYGLTMFFILSEEEAEKGFYDSITKMGTANGVDYYFATTTDVSLAPIIEHRDFWFDSDEELELTKKDWEKAKIMMDFYSSENIQNFIKNFSEIK
ncbi:MAG: hypothetical protein IKJ06_02360 [Clostridia bacterium]|nr:hypothetical protein [Clostridia bacterium]